MQTSEQKEAPSRSSAEFRSFAFERARKLDQILKSGENEDLFAALHGTEDSNEKERIRSALVSKNSKLVSLIAWKYRSRGLPIEDLNQEGLGGLLKAINKFKPALNLKFSTLAANEISGSIRHAIRDTASMIRQPREVSDCIYAILQVKEVLENSVGGDPTAAETASFAGIPLPLVENVLSLYELANPRSLDEPLGEEEQSLYELLASPEAAPYHELELRDVRAIALQQLNDFEREVWERLYIDGKIPAQVAREMKTTSTTVSRIVKRGRKRMQEFLEDNGLEEFLEDSEKEESK